MSHWLSNVNNLLTKLDDQVETAVEERALAQDDLTSEGIGVAIAGIDDILAKRGLSLINSTDVMEENEEETNIGMIDNEDEDEIQDAADQPHEEKAAESQRVNSTDTEYKSAVDRNKTVPQCFDNIANINFAQKDRNREEQDEISTSGRKESPTRHDSEAVSFQPHVGGILTDGALEKKITTEEEVTTQKHVKMHEIEQNIVEEHDMCSSTNLPAVSKSEDESSSIPSSPPKLFTSTTKLIPPMVQSSVHKEPKSQSETVHSTDRSRQDTRELIMERKEAQKEARTLRRHIVSLNDQLESAESELQAQRKELERAAERMEKDRIRHEKEKEASQIRKTEEITLLKTQHEKSLNDQQARFEEQLERFRTKLSEEERRRKQEGGDWDKEISDAIDREHIMRRNLNLLEDEKRILLSQISTLQGQQTALGSRLESLSEAADNAIQRERDAENRLDNVLNQHARQISHRQARESQLERTIQDLNAALVESRGNPQSTIPSGLSGDGDFDHALRGNNHLEARISALESDLETASSHLAIEKERSETLQIQLRSFSNETTQEATIIHAKEIQYDRQIADMSITISELEAKLRNYEKLSPDSSGLQANSLNDQKLPHQIKFLSEEVVRLRNKIGSLTSESLTMKSRLKTAVERSNKLEDELQIAKMSSNCDEITHGRNTAPGGRRRTYNSTKSDSIRTAMLLNSLNGERTEQIGEVVDQIDSFAASTGKYLRRNPIARAGFIFYLILIHLWTFVLLFLHAHSFHAVPERGFVSDGAYPHGPHAVMQQQQVRKNLVLN